MMSLTEQILPLATQGLSIPEIAEETGIPHRTVSKAVSRLRWQGEPIPRIRSPRSKALENVRAAAAKRGVTVRQLWAEIQRVIAGDDLFDAILDDGGAE